MMQNILKTLDFQTLYFGGGKIDPKLRGGGGSLWGPYGSFHFGNLVF